jgi:hypothetical protein
MKHESKRPHHPPQPPKRNRALAKLGAVTATIIVPVLFLTGCDGNAVKSVGTTTLALKECRTPKVDTAVKCATFEVIENRETNTGRKIALNIVVLPATARVKEPDPIFLFAGGPGQAATDLAVQANMILGQLNAKRDIVLIDQRGTGKSNLLNCKMPSADTLDMASAEKRRAVSRNVAIHSPKKRI